jgi:Fic family protein
MFSTLKIIPVNLLPVFKKTVDETHLLKYRHLEDGELSVDDFSFYTSVAAVYSSKIEGEDIELDSYVKHKRFGISFQPDYTRKIDDLYETYQFAKTAVCNEDNLSRAHALLSRHLLPKNKQGVHRTGNMFVTTDDGKIEYVAATPGALNGEMQKLNSDIKTLLNSNLTVSETFYFAAMLHLVFVKIHPFEDGNGRTGRLLEKWFLASKLGEKAWLIPSERYYYQNHANYFLSLRQLGLEYDLLDYSKALPFVLMLSASVSE